MVIGSSRFSSRWRVRSRNHSLLDRVLPALRSLMVAGPPKGSALLVGVLLPGDRLVSARPVAKVTAPQGFQDRRVSTESVLKATWGQTYRNPKVPGPLVHVLMGYRGCCRRRGSPRPKSPCLIGRHRDLGFGATSRSRPGRSQMPSTFRNLTSGLARPSSCHRESERCCFCRPAQTRNRPVRPQCWHCRGGSLSADCAAARWPPRRVFPRDRCMRPPPGSARVSACESPLRPVLGSRYQRLQDAHQTRQEQRAQRCSCLPRSQLKYLRFQQKHLGRWP